MIFNIGLMPIYYNNYIKGLCRKCLLYPQDVLYEPCKHFFYCKRCVDRIKPKECQKCFKKVEKWRFHEEDELIFERVRCHMYVFSAYLPIGIYANEYGIFSFIFDLIFEFREIFFIISSGGMIFASYIVYVKWSHIIWCYGENIIDMLKLIGSLAIETLQGFKIIFETIFFKPKDFKRRNEAQKAPIQDENTWNVTKENILNEIMEASRMQDEAFENHQNLLLLQREELREQRNEARLIHEDFLRQIKAQEAQFDSIWRSILVQVEKMEEDLILNTTNNHLDLDVVQEKNTDNCVLCHERPLELAMKPCGHVCVCSKCGPRLKGHCPVCKEVINKAFRIYFP